MPSSQLLFFFMTIKRGTKTLEVRKKASGACKDPISPITVTNIWLQSQLFLKPFGIRLVFLALTVTQPLGVCWLALIVNLTQPRSTKFQKIIVKNYQDHVSLWACIWGVVLIVN